MTLDKFTKGPKKTVSRLNEIIDWVNSFRISVGPGLDLHRAGNTWLLNSTARGGASAGGAGVSSEFWAEITASGRAPGVPQPFRWIYNFREVEKKRPGYGGYNAPSLRAWMPKTGGRTGSAYNSIEDMNPEGATGLQGNGTLRENLPGTFALQPAPVGVVLLMREVTFDYNGQSVTERWFQYENATDGECE